MGNTTFIHGCEIFSLALLSAFYYTGNWDDDLNVSFALSHHPKGLFVDCRESFALIPWLLSHNRARLPRGHLALAHFLPSPQ